jgi:cardiolipin synthase
MEDFSWTATVTFLVDLLIRLGLSVRVIMRRRPVGVSLAWLVIVLLVPFLGAVIYLFVGELWLGRRRAEWAAKIHGPYEKWLAALCRRTHVDWSAVGQQCEPIANLIHNVSDMPALPGNRLQLHATPADIFRALVADIDAAGHTCHLEFYIWNVGGMADEVGEALLRAAARGVICRVLLDAVGSHPFLHSDWAAKLRKAGVMLRAALPGGLIRGVFVRYDLRLHRKIVVIDGEIAYTGSMNLVDPRYFKQTAGVGQWIDAMVRLRGPAVQELAATFIEDWELETGEGLERLGQTADLHAPPDRGHAVVQVAASGPLVQNDAIQQILLMAIYTARKDLVLTTPYFVPEEPLLMALASAAQRGVAVTIVVPARVDSRLVRLASQAHQGDLLLAGARVVLFDGGLLHTKSITVDGELSLFGSLNLDPRSLHLNFEVTLAVYDAEFTCELRKLQQSYIDRSEAMDLEAWQHRPALVRFTENAARLLGPLL